MVKRRKRATKAILLKKNVTGRQLARVSAIKYRETLWSELYPGNQHTVHCFQPAVLAIESSLELDERQRKRTVWRMDGGAGTDEHIKWLLARGYHVIAKGLSHFRAAKLAQQAKRWDAYDDWWLAEVPPSVDYGCPIRVFVRRRLKDDKWRHSYYLSTLQLPSKGCFLDFYHRRGGAEVEQFRQDKSGLNLATRRKQSFTGQLGYILLTDLAHNLLADFHHKALVGSRFENYGLKRIVRDLLNVPGRLVVENNQLKSVELLTLMKNSKDLIICLERYISAQ